ARAEPQRGIPELTGPAEPLGRNEAAVGHDPFAGRATLPPDLALDDGANSIGADHDVRLCMSTVCEGEMNAIALLLELGAPVTEIDRCFRERGKQQIQKIGAV